MNIVKTQIINLLSMENVLNKYGIKIIVDVVLRHVAGDEREHLKPHRLVDPELLKYLERIKDLVKQFI